MRRPGMLWLWVVVCLAVPLRAEDPPAQVFSWIGATGRVLDGVTPRSPGPTLKSSIGMGGYNAAIVIDKLGG